MARLRNVAQRLLKRVDERYHRTHQLQAAGPVLYVGRAAYRGPAMRFEDGTLLAVGDTVGMLHFNNARFIEIDAASSTAAALSFMRLMLQSMRGLAELARAHPRFSDIQVFHAVSWLPPHGRRIGFVTARFPEGMQRAFLAAYMKLLVWAFASVEQSGIAAKPDPHYYWLTRGELLRKFPDRAAPASDFRRRMPIDVEMRVG
jgi:hypothetical protein